VLQINGLSKAFQVRDLRVSAVRAVNLDVAQGEFFVLLGPSGCGKTTMLRSIAGLERPDTGEIRIDGEVVFSSRERLFVPPERRSIAMVFQSYAIWPHMNVYENVAFPLREGVRRLPPDQVRVRAAEVLDLLALADLAERPVTTLSGGQQQRVALARALALRPKILLMDEPLSNLDYKLQIRLRTQLKELMNRLRLTTVYVTHNQKRGDGDRRPHRGDGPRRDGSGRHPTRRLPPAARRVRRPLHRRDGAVAGDHDRDGGRLCPP
jgi:ABC-type Fe3+/spermidine/putrescine transport system ATPase subunit